MPIRVPTIWRIVPKGVNGNFTNFKPSFLLTKFLRTRGSRVRVIHPQATAPQVTYVTKLTAAKTRVTATTCPSKLKPAQSRPPRSPQKLARPPASNAWFCSSGRLWLACTDFQRTGQDRTFAFLILWQPIATLRRHFLKEVLKSALLSICTNCP